MAQRSDRPKRRDRRAWRGAIAGVALAGVLAAPAASLAQDESPAQLRRRIGVLQAENDRLRQSLDASQAELEHLRDRLRELAGELTQLREALSTGVAAAALAGASEAKADVPADPMACPESLFRGLLSRYEEAFDTPLPSGGDDLADRLERVEDWTRGIRGELSDRVRWLVRVGLDPLQEGRRSRGPRTGLLKVLDPATRLPIGFGVSVTVPSRYVTRIERREDGDLWWLSGELRAEPRFNPARETPGPFDHPRFIGAFAEFGFELDWSMLLATTEDGVDAELAESVKSPPAEPVER